MEDATRDPSPALRAISPSGGEMVRGELRVGVSGFTSSPLEGEGWGAGAFLLVSRPASRVSLFAPPLSSTSTTTDPFDTRSPFLIATLFTTPAAVDGTSI